MRTVQEWWRVLAHGGRFCKAPFRIISTWSIHSTCSWYSSRLLKLPCDQSGLFSIHLRSLAIFWAKQFVQWLLWLSIERHQIFKAKNASISRTCTGRHWVTILPSLPLSPSIFCWVFLAQNGLCRRLWELMAGQPIGPWFSGFYYILYSNRFSSTFFYILKELVSALELPLESKRFPVSGDASKHETQFVLVSSNCQMCTTSDCKL